MHTPARILVVDDTPENLEIMTMRLQRHGYEIVTAVDGEDALAKVQTSSPDLILLDITMPKLDGIAVTRRLKADTSLPFIPIILLTAKADTKDVIAGLDAGGDDYLTKPIRVERLVVPAAKACCSIRSVRFPARAHSRAMATPLIPPPMITTWKRSLSSVGRVALAEIMFQIAQQHARRAKNGRSARL